MMTIETYRSMINEIVEKTQSALQGNLPKNCIDIFLCGGAKKEQAKFRFSLGEKLESIKAKNKYNVYYPETLFAEITNGYKKRDLLTLENILALSVNSVVVPLESPGTFAELGAFANHETLKDKLIVIAKPKYKIARSFINDGPIAKIKKSETSKILYYDMTEANVNAISYKITETSRSIAAKKPVELCLKNPLFAMIYYFLLVYVFDPINEEDISNIVASEMQHDSEAISFETAVAFLSSSGIIRMIKYPYYSVAENGFNRFFSKYGYSTDEKRELRESLEEARILAINLTYRKNRRYGEK